MTICVDTREPHGPDGLLHPWQAYWPDDVRVVRDTLETGDLCLRALPDGGIVERKAIGDFVSALGSQRERFQRELARSRHCGSFCIIVEGDLRDVLAQARGMNHNSVLGTVATWSRRYCPILFAGTVPAAADLAYRFLAGQVREAERTAKALKAEATKP